MVDTTSLILKILILLAYMITASGMDISFVGILTVVAYQVMIGEILARIDYLTLMSTFLYLSFISLAVGVFVNLYVAHLDH